MDFWNVLENRHSMRSFSDEPVAHESVQLVIHAAGQAPSAMNMQPWKFHITTGAHRIRLGEVVAQATVHLAEYMDVMGPDVYEQAVKWYSELGGAPVVIGVSMPVVSDEIEKRNWLISIGAAIENLLLAATAEGLGACNITVPEWIQEGLDEVFEVAGDRTVVGVIALGHPGTLPSEFPEKHADNVEWLE